MSVLTVIKLAYRIYQRTSDVLGQLDEASTDVEIVESRAIQLNYRRVFCFAFALAAVGIAVPCLVACVMALTHRITWTDAGWRMLIAGMLSFPCSLFHFFCGIAAASLALPDSFLSGRAGIVLLDLIGTRSVRVSRALGVTASMVSAALLFAQAWITITIAPIR